MSGNRFPAGREEVPDKQSAARREEETSVMPESLEQEIKILASESGKDADKALSFAKKHPLLHDDFSVLVNMRKIIREDPETFVNCMGDSHFITTPLMDFWALIGGAKAIVEEYVNQLKKLGVTYVAEEHLRNCTDADMTAWMIIRMMRLFFVNATDCSTHFAAGLAEETFFHYLADDIKHQDENVKLKGGVFCVFEISVTILHNCAKNDHLRQYFRDIELVKLLTPFLKTKEKDMKLITLLTISYIIDEEDNHILAADGSDLIFLLDMISAAWKDCNHKTYDGYNLEELLRGLRNLAQNEDNKKLLTEKEALVPLKPILRDGWDGEKKEATSVVWMLAFRKENGPLMKADEELIQLLNILKESSHLDVAKASRGALWELNTDATLAKSSGYVQPSPAEGQGHIMISYNWGNQEILLKIRDKLRDQFGFKIWMDVDNMTGSLLNAMADAVEKASVVLICMSQRYKDSPNCRSEAAYANKLRKPIIPLMMERNFKADGWLGFLVGDSLYFDFSGKRPFDKMLKELLKELQHKLGNLDFPDGAHAPATTDTEVKGVGSWSTDDVRDWINKNHLERYPRLQSLSGENIKFLHKLKHTAPEFYFTYLSQRLDLTTLDGLMLFCDAIDKLP